jgi:hypothetical protein
MRTLAMLETCCSTSLMRASHRMASGQLLILHVQDRHARELRTGRGCPGGSRVVRCWRGKNRDLTRKDPAPFSPAPMLIFRVLPRGSTAAVASCRASPLPASRPRAPLATLPNRAHIAQGRAKVSTLGPCWSRPGSSAAALSVCRRLRPLCGVWRVHHCRCHLA